MDDGQVFGKGGEPIPVNPQRGIETVHPHAKVQHMDDGEIVAPPVKVVPPEPPNYVFVCDKTTWQRNLDGYQALHLLNTMLGGNLSATVTHDELAKLPSDIRWHFRRREVPKPPIDPLAEEDADLRAQLTALGVRPDGQWSIAQLREEIEVATRPNGEAA